MSTYHLQLLDHAPAEFWGRRACDHLDQMRVALDAGRYADAAVYAARARLDAIYAATCVRTQSGARRQEVTR